MNIHTWIVSPGEDWGLGLLVDCLYVPKEFILLSWEFPMFNWKNNKFWMSISKKYKSFTGKITCKEFISVWPPTEPQDGWVCCWTGDNGIGWYIIVPWCWCWRGLIFIPFTWPVTQLTFGFCPISCILMLLLQFSTELPFPGLLSTVNPCKKQTLYDYHSSKKLHIFLNVLKLCSTKCRHRESFKVYKQNKTLTKI